MKTVLHLSIAFCWTLALSVVSTSTHAVALESTGNSTRFNYFHAFGSDPAAVVDTVRAEQPALLEAKPQLIVVTTPDASAGSNVSSTKNTTGDYEGELKPQYSFVGENRIGFVSSQWQVDRDIQRNGSVWTRLKTLNTSEMDVCVVVVATTSMNSELLIELTGSVDKFCAKEDVVLLGFTSPLSDDLAQYLEAKTAINGQYAPRIMKESVALAEQTNNIQLDVEAATNRLFVAPPAESTVCLESAGGTTVAANKLTTQRIALCMGGGCSTCRQSQTTTDSQGSPVKRGLIVLFSCGTFLIGCAVVFYVLFRKQFFMPSDSTKPEKELTTNLAYVLRM